MKNRTKENCVEKILGICFVAVSILILGIAAACTVFSQNTAKTSEKITGTITEIYDNSGISVEYSYNGQKYEAGISEYSSSMRVGKEIPLYVNKENPQKVRTAALLYLPSFVLCCVGVPFAIVGMIFIIIVGKSRKKKKYLLQNGKRIMAEITGGMLNYNYRLNGRHPWKLECRYEDIFTGAVYLFSSENIWIDPQMYIGQQVAVYVDGENYKKYYVDVDSLLAAENSRSQIYDYR